MCQYAYYNEKESKPQIYCKLNNRICLFSKYCIKKNKYIHKEGAENCYMAINEKKKNIPSGSYYVRFIKKGYVYIEIDDKIIKVKDTIGNINNYVYLKQDNGEYIISLEPFEEEPKKRQYRKKK